MAVPSKEDFESFFNLANRETQCPVYLNQAVESIALDEYELIEFKFNADKEKRGFREAYLSHSVVRWFQQQPTTVRAMKARQNSINIRKNKGRRTSASNFYKDLDDMYSSRALSWARFVIEMKPRDRPPGGRWWVELAKKQIAPPNYQSKDLFFVKVLRAFYDYFHTDKASTLNSLSKKVGPFPEKAHELIAQLEMLVASIDEESLRFFARKKCLELIQEDIRGIKEKIDGWLMLRVTGATSFMGRLR